MPTLITDLTLHQRPPSTDTWTYRWSLFHVVCAPRNIRNSKTSRATPLFHYFMSGERFNSQSPFPCALLRSSKGNPFITLASAYRILIGLHHPLIAWSIRCGLLVLCFAFPCVLGFSFPLCDPLCSCCFPFPSFNRVILFINPPLFHFLVVFSAVSRWLVRGPHQTALPPLETLLQSYANNLLQELPLRLVTHPGIPPSFQTGLRGLRPLNLTNCSPPPYKPVLLYAPFLITKCYTHCLPQPC